MESCPECNLCEVMQDGSLFCALLEQNVHGDQTCQYWLNDPELFIKVEEGIGYGKADRQG